MTKMPTQWYSPGTARSKRAQCALRISTDERPSLPTTALSTWTAAILLTMRTDESCTFCRIVHGSDPAYVVYEDAHAIAFLDRQPAAEWHTLVVPRTHSRSLFDIDPLNAGALMTSATFVARKIRRIIRPDGMTLIQSNEHAGGQTVFHVHLHLVPRWNGDNLITPWRAERANADELAAIQSRMMAPVEDECVGPHLLNRRFDR